MAHVHRWTMKLEDQYDDEAWGTDTSGIRKIYVGDVCIIGEDEDGNIVESQMIRGGIYDMPYPPARFLQPKDEESRVSPVKHEDSEESVASVNADAGTKRRPYGGGARWIFNTKVGPRPRKKARGGEVEVPKKDSAGQEGQ